MKFLAPVILYVVLQSGQGSNEGTFIPLQLSYINVEELKIYPKSYFETCFPIQHELSGYFSFSKGLEKWRLFNNLRFKGFSEALQQLLNLSLRIKIRSLWSHRYNLICTFSEVQSFLFLFFSSLPNATPTLPHPNTFYFKSL